MRHFVIYEHQVKKVQEFGSAYYTHEKIRLYTKFESVNLKEKMRPRHKMR